MNKPQRDNETARITRENFIVAIKKMYLGIFSISFLAGDGAQVEKKGGNKKKCNDISGRTDGAGLDNMGYAIALALIGECKNIILEVRFGMDHFKTTYIKCPSLQSNADSIFKDRRRFLLILDDDINPTKYACYSYLEVSNHLIRKGGKGNKNKLYWTVNATPIPIRGVANALEPCLSLDKQLIKCIEAL